MSFVVIVDNRFYYLLKFISLRSRPSFDRRFYEKSETGKEGTLWGVALLVPLFSLKLVKFKMGGVAGNKIFK